MDKLPQDFVQTLQDNPLILFVVEQVLVNYNGIKPGSVPFPVQV